jgi:hypothetical protein
MALHSYSSNTVVRGLFTMASSQKTMLDILIAAIIVIAIITIPVSSYAQKETKPTT